MNKKILKYLELSKEFTECPEFYTLENTICTQGNVGLSCINPTTSLMVSGLKSNEESFTKLELFEKEKLALIEKAKRYEEFLILQKDLTDYFAAEEKLNN